MLIEDHPDLQSQLIAELGWVIAHKEREVLSTHHYLLAKDGCLVYLFVYLLISAALSWPAAKYQNAALARTSFDNEVCKSAQTYSEVP
ncbi:MAG: hypothetical protein AB2551_11045 [Candidatus Thiodiazotropha sp.]